MVDNNGIENSSANYRLRCAGGVYWLIDVTQTGMPYKEPVAINAVGADIWKMYEQNLSEEEIIRCISQEYGIEWDNAREDVQAFLTQLKVQNVI